MPRKSLILATVTLVTLSMAGLPAASLAHPQPPVEAPEHDTKSGAEGPAGYLGVTVRPLNPELRRHFGAPSDRGLLVATVEVDSPADRAGLEVGDVLVAVDGVEVSSVRSLAWAVQARGGRSVELDVFRDGDRMSLEATLAERISTRRHRRSHPAGDWESDWVEWGDDWADWGAEFGERWAEFGARMGERWGERGSEWGELGAEWGEIGSELGELGSELGELGAQIGIEMGEIGAEIGSELGEAFAEMDWDEFGDAIDESMAALDAIDWDDLGTEIERTLEEVERTLEELERTLEEEGFR